MPDIPAMVTVGRRELADLLDTLTPEQWDTPSLCRGWTVRDVAAHLIMPLETSMPKFLVKMVASGFDFNKVADKVARGDARSGPELAQALRAGAAHPFTPPGFGPEAPLTDVFVHGQDIRRPLHLSYLLEAERARIILDLLVTPKAARAFGAKGRADGVRLRAPDVNWEHGEGPEIVGPAEALILALAGRAVALDDLEGDGLAAWRDPAR